VEHGVVAQAEQHEIVHVGPSAVAQELARSCNPPLDRCSGKPRS